MTTACVSAAEAERSPRVRTRNFAPTPLPLRATPDGYWALPLQAGSPRVATPYGTSLSLGSVLHLRLPPDAPSQASRRARRTAPASTSTMGPVPRVSALVVGAGFPPSGSPEDLAHASPPVPRPCRAHLRAGRDLGGSRFPGPPPRRPRASTLGSRPIVLARGRPGATRPAPLLAPAGHQLGAVHDLGRVLVVSLAP